MRVWAVGLVVVLMAGGAAGGYLLGAPDEPEVVSFDGPSPVAAVSPSVPVEPPVIQQDPDLPALQPAVELHDVTVGDKPFDLKLQVPVGWARSIPQAGEWRWYPPPGDVFNTYFLRVKLVANLYQPVESMLEARIDALDGAEGVKDFVVESRTDNGFVVNSVSGGFRRVEMETYIAQPDSDLAFAWIGLVGREVDRDGMTDLIARINESARQGPDYR